MALAEVPAYAKINLTLDVLGKRPDGYHELCMVMQTVSLADTVRVETGAVDGLRVSTNLSFLPNNEKNLAAAAALRFREATGLDLGGLTIRIEKHIPVCAGLAGGSSDAAAVLRALNTLTGANLPPEKLAEIGETVGSDVPYCVLGGTALAEGRGERLTPLPPLPPCWVVLCKPDFSVPTPKLFAQLDSVKLRRRPDTAGLTAALAAGDLRGAAMRMYNVFEDVLPPQRRRMVEEVKTALIGAGALGASMSGTGPTVFGFFSGESVARAAWEELRRDWRETFLVQTV